jgi:transcriptional repressor NrdR
VAAVARSPTVVSVRPERPRTAGYHRGMNCPACRADETKVVDSRDAEEGTAVRRRRQCLACSHRFTTYERVDHALLAVIKAHGGREPFDRKKVVRGLRAATTGRGVDDDRLDEIAMRVEDSLRLQGAEVSSANVGVAVLDQLRSVDDVAYLRFASVYKNFDAAADFHRELELLDKTGPAV